MIKCGNPKRKCEEKDRNGNCLAPQDPCPTNNTKKNAKKDSFIKKLSAIEKRHYMRIITARGNYDWTNKEYIKTLNAELDLVGDGIDPYDDAYWSDVLEGSFRL